MKIAIVTWWYAKGMGYSENYLPEVLASLGHEVHVISSDLQPDFPNYKEAYEPFIGPQQQPVGVEKVGGYTLHRLPHRRTHFGIYIDQLHECLNRLDPDIVQCFGIPQRSTYQAALYCLLHRTPLFLEEHTHLSTLRPPESWRHTVNNMLVKYVLGPYVAMASRHCYAIAADVEQVTLQHFGYPKKKLSVQSLGVDTNLFRPVQDSEDERQRQSLRFHLGISADEVVYIYTGRFSSDKSPLLLAKAVDLLRQRGNPVRAVFIGSGAKEDVDSIRQHDGCVVLPFMSVNELPQHYRMADVGVWPKQESTSQLDALACGLPLVLSDRVQARERIEGCGYTYKEGDHDSLAGAMLQLMPSAARGAMGKVGAKRVRDLFSWTHIAKTRLQDYEQALTG